MDTYHWLDDNGAQIAYSPLTNKRIVTGVSSGKKEILFCPWDPNKKTHKIVLKRKLIQVNIATGKQRPVKKIALGNNQCPTGTGAWEWEECYGVWMPYDVSSSKHLEAEFLKQRNTTTLNLFQSNYTIDLNQMKQIKDSTGFTRNIRRVMKSSPVVSTSSLGSSDEESSDSADSSDDNSTQVVRAQIADTSIKSLEELEKLTKWKEVSELSTVEGETCSICLCEFDQQEIDDKNCVRMSKCEAHYFHPNCLLQAFRHKKSCPNCTLTYAPEYGTQPLSGTMKIMTREFSLPGYRRSKTLEIEYMFKDGIQGEEHPNPGKRYHGTIRTAFLPATVEGQRVLKRLIVAFQRRLVFTVGRSITTGRDNCVVWNGIHHKTNTRGGSSNFGYPDTTYLSRVGEELAAKGIL